MPPGAGPNQGMMPPPGMGPNPGMMPPPPMGGGMQMQQWQANMNAGMNIPFPGSSNFMTNTTSTLENKIKRVENHLKRLEKRITTLEHDLHGSKMNSDNYQYSSLQMM